MSVMHPYTVSEIVDLAKRGLSDREIAVQVGLTRGQVWYLRTREGVAAALPCGGAGRWHPRAKGQHR